MVTLVSLVFFPGGEAWRTDIDSLAFTASDMSGVDTITADNFSAAITSESYCSATNSLADGTPVDVPFTLNRGSGPASADLRFCVLKVPDAVAQTFTSGSWEIDIRAN